MQPLAIALMVPEEFWPAALPIPLSAHLQKQISYLQRRAESMMAKNPSIRLYTMLDAAHSKLSTYYQMVDAYARDYALHFDKSAQRLIQHDADSIILLLRRQMADFSRRHPGNMPVP